MKTVTVKVRAPDWVDEKALERVIRRALRQVIPPPELSAEEVEETFGVMKEDVNIKIEDISRLREKEKERLRWLY